MVGITGMGMDEGLGGYIDLALDNGSTARVWHFNMNNDLKARFTEGVNILAKVAEDKLREDIG